MPKIVWVNGNFCKRPQKCSATLPSTTDRVIWPELRRCTWLKTASFQFQRHARTAKNPRQDTPTERRIYLHLKDFCIQFLLFFWNYVWKLNNLVQWWGCLKEQIPFDRSWEFYSLWFNLLVLLNHSKMTVKDLLNCHGSTVDRSDRELWENVQSSTKHCKNLRKIPHLIPHIVLLLVFLQTIGINSQGECLSK